MRKILPAILFLTLAAGLAYYAYTQNIFQSGTINIIFEKEPDAPVAQPLEEVDVVVEEKEVAEEKVEANLDVKKEETEKNEIAKREEKEEKEKNPAVINKIVSWGYAASSGRKIDTVIIHSSYDALGSDPYDLEGLIKEYKQYGVAPHYLIDRKSKIYLLVGEKNVAYHAGESQTPDGRSNVNNFSIGIELMNKEESKFTVEQYSSLNKLISEIKKRYAIKYVLGHNQIAPGRKTDPWNFDWEKL